MKRFVVFIVLMLALCAAAAAEDLSSTVLKSCGPLGNAANFGGTLFSAPIVEAQPCRPLWPVGNCQWVRCGNYETLFCPPGPLTPPPPDYPDPNSSPEPPGSCSWEYNYDYVGPDGSGPILKRRCCNGACGQWTQA